MTATEQRDAALDRLEVAREGYVDHARAIARQLGHGGRIVTIDMVRRVCPPPDDVDPRVMGCILRAPEWVRVGYVNSARKRCHARPIGQFRLA